MRKRLFEIIEVGKDDDKLSRAYDIFMMICIVVSIIPLCTQYKCTAFDIIDKITVIIFIIDYLLRLITADYKINKGISSYIRYPFTAMAIIDLVSILPSVTTINGGFRLFKIFRLFRTFKVFRVFKAFRYSKNIQIIVNVFKKQKDSLLVVGGLALGYIFITAIIILNVEPETFPNLFKALYWSTVSLTTVGYGDLYATSEVGQVITMLSALFGIAIVALPAGIITAGYMDEVNKQKTVQEDEMK